MKTLKLKTVEGEYDVSDYDRNYTYMFRKLYANFELSEDKNFQHELQEKHNLDSWFFQSCKIEVKTKLDQKETFDNQNKIELANLEKELLEDEFEEGKKGRRRKFKVQQKIKNLKSSIGRDITFGTRDLLQRISFLSNPISKNILKDKSEEEIKGLEGKRIKDLEECKKEYQEARVLSIYSIGHAKENGNRKFKFDFKNKKVIFKPECGKKIEIEFYCSEKQHEELCKLQEMIGELPISVQLNNEYICLIFDEEKLAGYAFNEKEYKKERNNIPKEDIQAIKECGKKWKIEKESRMIIGKINGRWLCLDLNPFYIGFAILQKVGESDFKIIYAECISFENLNTKLGLSTEDVKQIKQNNKRIHELYEVWKYIFNKARHFGVSACAIENLGFEKESINEHAKEANRQTKNLWHRTRTVNVVKKYCAERGIKLVPVPTPYSTFVGNIKYNYFDPVNAAIEIGRRGITKYLKGFFYPPLERSDIDTMSQIFGLDVQSKTILTWVGAFKLFKTSELRYRRGLHECSSFAENNLLSYKSGVLRYHFI